MNVEIWENRGRRAISLVAALRRGEAYFRKASEEGITIIYTRANKGVNYAGKDQRRYRS